MASILIAISPSIGPNANVFNIYHTPVSPSNDGTLIASNITKSQLFTGYTVNVPDGVTVIRVRGVDNCESFDDALIPCNTSIPSDAPVTATPTPTPIPVIQFFSALSGSTPSDGVQNDLFDFGIAVSMKFQVSQNGYIQSLNFYKPEGMTGTNRLMLYQYDNDINSNTLLADVISSDETLDGWQIVNISPVTVYSGITYRVVLFNSDGDYVSTEDAFVSSIVVGPITILGDGVEGPNSEYVYTDDPAAIPSIGYNSSNYWIDVEFAVTSAFIPTQTPTPTPTPFGAATPTPTLIPPVPTTTPTTGQTVVTFTQINSNTDVPGYGRSLQKWNTAWEVDYPTNGSPQEGNCFDFYYRFEWKQIQNDNASFTWTFFDSKINEAIENKRRFNFGVMPYYSGAWTASNVGGGILSYPLFVHNQMQGESAKDWINSSEGCWTPDWNSPSYLAAWEDLQLAIANHIATTSYLGVPYSSVIGYVDVRGYGNWGEWHSYPFGEEAGATSRPVTVATGKRIIDANLNAFPNYWNLIGFQSFGPGAWDLRLPELGHYALTASNAKGKLGWFRDSWGGPQVWYRDNLEGNTQTYAGQTFSDLALNSYRYAPVGGEPYDCCTTDGSSASDYYYDLYREVTTYKVAGIGNGNLQNPSSSTTISRMQQAGRAMGYRMIITSGTTPTFAVINQPFTITLNWRNIGITPVYDDWDVYYQLRNNSNTVVWRQKSTKVIKLFLPEEGQVAHTDSLTVTGVTNGTYKLEIAIEDPLGYKNNFSLAIQGKTAYNSYVIQNIFTIASATPTPTPLPPTPTPTPTAGTTGTTSSLSFTVIPTTDPEILNPMRGAEYWQNQWPEMSFPTDADPQPLLDRYWRYNWFELEVGNGIYDFTVLDEAIKDCIDSGVGRKFYFGGVMAYYSGTGDPARPIAGGYGMSYPLYLHNQMQAETYKDWASPEGWWVPNYNSNAFLTALENLYIAIRSWMDNTYYKGVRYIDVVNRYDIRAFGNYGEWHHWGILTYITENNDGSSGSWPVGRRPTVASLQRLIDAHVDVFPDKIGTIPLSGLDANYLQNTFNPPEIAQYFMELVDGGGKKLGIRRDNWGGIVGLGNTFYRDYMEFNDRFTAYGDVGSVEIMNRWKEAPWCGELYCDGTDQPGLLEEVDFYRCSSVGNGNFCTGSNLSATLKTNFRDAVKAMGYRLIVSGGTATNQATGNGQLQIILNWKNVGNSPVYEDWDTVFEIQNKTTNVAIWSGTSQFDVKYFLPDVNFTGITDTFTLPGGISTGTFRLVLKIKDPGNYRNPIALAVQGRRDDGSYTLVDSLVIT